ncbi:MAG: UDP-N-acetylmuramoyl-L-alanine--D-glutamate ligase [Dehalococcoidia bacterium]|nr:UDP-N-acetylmuramoyl-L-alanine--D-glutamate ligase [Dehalococcoidia bacterium]
MIGLGIEGIDLVRFLAGQGARVTVSDARPAEALSDALAAIADVDATLSLGGNRPEDATSADCVFVSQGVPRDLPAITAAEDAGVPVSSMAQLFLDLCPAPVAAVTGSSGKTTTTALVGAMLDASGQNYVVGGNIGVGLLGLLERIEPHTRVMIELSHTQLETVTRSPELACVTNVTPNHLDHYSWSAYVALKRRIFQFQRPEDTCVFNLDDEVSASFARETPGRVAYTSLVRSLPGDGVALVDGVVTRFEGSTSFAVAARSDIRLRGQHNVENVLSAVALASRLGVSDQQAAAAIRTFTGVPHRLEPVATIADVVYINDSIATTPERTLAGMRSFEQPLVLLLGGRHKYLPVGELASEATRRCRAVIAFGEAGEMFASAVRDADGGSSVRVEQVADVETAVRAAHRLAQAGDVVLFAPAGSSFDAYPNFERRGAAYREAVRQLAGED